MNDDNKAFVIYGDELRKLTEALFNAYPCTCGNEAPCKTCQVAIVVEELKFDPSEVILEKSKEHGW